MRTDFEVKLGLLYCTGLHIKSCIVDHDDLMINITDPSSPSGSVGSDVDGEASDDDETDNDGMEHHQRNRKTPTTSNSDEGQSLPRKSAAQIMRDKKKQTALTLSW